MPDLIAALGELDDENPTLATIATLLLRLGFVDVTERVTPPHLDLEH